MRLVVALLIASPASACTLCHSSVAEQVRAALAADWLSNLAGVAAPLPLLVGLVLFVARRR